MNLIKEYEAKLKEAQRHYDRLLSEQSKEWELLQELVSDINFYEMAIILEEEYYAELNCN